MERLIAEGKLTEDSEEVRFTRTLLDIAKAYDLDTWAPIALAYLFTKYPLTFPLIGIDNVEVCLLPYRSKCELMQ